MILLPKKNKLTFLIENSLWKNDPANFIKIEQLTAELRNFGMGTLST